MSTATPAAFGATAASSTADRAGSARRGSWRGTILTLVIGFLLGAVTVAAVGFWYLAESEPDFYTRALEATPPAERRAQAEAFTERTVELARDVEYGDTWEQRFTQDEVNGWLAESLPEQYGDQIPNEVSDPRVDLTRPGLVRLGFRLNSSKFDGVVSLAVRPEMIGPNKVALHVEGLMAGLFPLDPATFAPQVSKYLEKYKVRHEWDLAPKAEGAEGAAAGPPVLIVQLNPRAANQAVLEEMEIDGGAVRVAGSRAPTVRLTRR
ncbi:hypothetical protein [Alienimonas chondri]|uniref:Uncharacterized protein n=1 Tax=Alienimonas chondri TaxID=2681879 RepID=A0ABX1VD20_9PLAN|nr:hypothetical protein [Alienimonas chondri]NNJ26007.1 hypothetical protein [Alienimonas chondri]